MYKIILAKTGQPQGTIIKGIYDKKILELTFDSVEEAGAYLIKLHGFEYERVNYDVIKVD